jgi:hypothetical protein
VTIFVLLRQKWAVICISAGGWRNEEMKPRKWLLLSVAAPLSVAVASADGAARRAPPVPPEESALLGDWRGESICVVRESACHDEDSLYHVTKLAAKPGRVSMKLDKIVNGKPVTMGVMDCSYSAAKQSLTCEFPRGVMRFKVDNNKMEGTMTLPDGTLWRKITLKKTLAS